MTIFSFSNLWKASKVDIEEMLHLLLLLSLSDIVACRNLKEVARTFTQSGNHKVESDHHKPYFQRILQIKSKKSS